MTARLPELTAAVRRLLAAVAIALLVTGSLTACDLSGLFGGGDSQSPGGGPEEDGGGGEDGDEDGDDEDGDDDD